MIVVTGAAGFIGSCLLIDLVRSGYADLVAVDDFSVVSKQKNYDNLTHVSFVEREVFIDWLAENGPKVQLVFHLGARTNTAEFDTQLLNKLNLHFSQAVWAQCVAHHIPLIYASSAATYGMGALGFDDTINPELLKPLNPYGVSKNNFDKWVLAQSVTPPFWAGFKFFNVFGPNEFHKGRMASVVFHAFNQIRQTGHVKLFQSHHPDFADGGQKRDFVYVKDVLKVLRFAMEQRKVSGIFNLGSGEANTFLDLASSVFEGLNLQPNISFVPTPEDIRDTYQYYTQASLGKLKLSGYNEPFFDFKEAVKDYVKNYLITGSYF